MSALEIGTGIVLLIFAIIIIAVVLLQEGRSAHLSGTISGGAESFLGKNKARTLDAFLARWTKVIAIVFFLLTVVVNVVSLIKK